MEVDVWMFLEPGIALLIGVEIIEDVVQRATREGGNQNAFADVGTQLRDISGEAVHD
jgi:hypothetical protein